MLDFDLIDLSSFFIEGPEVAIVASAEGSKEEALQKSYEPPFNPRLEGTGTNQVIIHCVRTPSLEKCPWHPDYQELIINNQSEDPSPRATMDKKALEAFQGIGDVMGTLGGFAMIPVSAHFFVPDSSAEKVQKTAEFTLKFIAENSDADEIPYMKVIGPWSKALTYLASVKLKYPTKPPVIQMVNPKNQAWHAGVSHWPVPNGKGAYEFKAGLNKSSVGIEFACPKYALREDSTVGANMDAHWDQDDWHRFAGFQKEQGEVGYSLVKHLLEEYTIPAHMVHYHSDIGWFRSKPSKTDPGPTFGEMAQMWAEKGVGFMPSLKEEVPSFETESEKWQWMVKRLKTIGYDVHPTWKAPVDYCSETLFFKAVDAFRMHFLPEEACAGLLMANAPFVLPEKDNPEKDSGEIPGWSQQSMRPQVLKMNGEKIITDTLLRALANKFPWEISEEI
jgi:N-acetyl-anhydromuramyl-L-alanine amidase AmpD